MDIKNVHNAVLFTSAALSIKDAVVDAVKQSKSLQGADLRSAYLQGADLQGADLQGADLRSVDLRSADLQGADLQGAYLQGADLRSAYLQGADLRGVDLRSVDLQGVDLQDVDLRGAYLQGALNAESALARVQFIPETGSFEGWKKCAGNVIVKLLIPEDAKRSHGSERKCRASKVVVLDVIGADIAYSGGGYKRAEYRKGETVTPDGWDEDRWNVCSHGIHFFLTKIEAEEHEL